MGAVPTGQRPSLFYRTVGRLAPTGSQPEGGTHTSQRGQAKVWFRQNSCGYIGENTRTLQAEDDDACCTKTNNQIKNLRRKNELQS